VLCGHFAPPSTMLSRHCKSRRTCRHPNLTANLRPPSASLLPPANRQPLTASLFPPLTASSSDSRPPIFHIHHQALSGPDDAALGQVVPGEQVLQADAEALRDT